jgi:hypothetical protein
MIFGGGLSLLPDHRNGYYGILGLGDVKDWCEASVKTWKEAVERMGG